MLSHRTTDDSKQEADTVNRRVCGAPGQALFVEVDEEGVVRGHQHVQPHVELEVCTNKVQKVKAINMVQTLIFKLFVPTKQWASSGRARWPLTVYQ